jgi:hypothetical protein
LISKNRFVILSISSAIVLGAALLARDDKRFQAGAAVDYPHLKSENVTVGAKPFDNDELVSSAFGKKIDFARYGVLPLLIVIENKRDKPLDLREMEASLVAGDGRHAKAVAPEDLQFLSTSGKHPSTTMPRSPVPLPKKKNPLNDPEIIVRAFSAKMLPPGDSASGFLYFEAKAEQGDKLYVNGLRDARSGQELLYFEFPLERP